MTLPASPVSCHGGQSKAGCHESHGRSHAQVAGDQQLLAASPLNQAGGNQGAQHIGGTNSSTGQRTRGNASLQAYIQ